MKALCVGQSSYNIVAISSEFPLENTKNKFEMIEECPGGCAVNMAYLLGKYGAESYVASVTGDDTYGTIVKKELEKIGVHTEYMETAYDKRTSMSFTIIGQKNKSRTIYDVTKEPLFLKKSEYQMDPDLVIVDGYDYGASLAALNKFSDKITIIDAGMYNKEIMELCKYVKYIVASKEFAEAVSGSRINYENPQSLVTIYSQLVNKFPGKTVVVTLEDKGAMYMVGNQIKVMPGLNLKVVDSSGAGDIFHAAFGYALAEGYDMERSITFANIAGGLCVTKVGTLAAVPDISDIMTYYNQKYNTPAAPANPAPAEGSPNQTNVAPASPAAPSVTPANNGQTAPSQAPSPAPAAPTPNITASAPSSPVQPPVTPAAPSPQSPTPTVSNPSQANPPAPGPNPPLS